MDTIEREVANLYPRFKVCRLLIRSSPLEITVSFSVCSLQVDLDQLHLIGSQDLHLVCRLEDKYLPSVPALRVIVPRDYPRTAPFCDSQQQDYGME